ncbi:hypothetical protein P4S73_19230 [Paraglaciecola sp. Hal342]
MLDEAGRIWVGTNRGLSVTNLQRKQSLYIGQQTVKRTTIIFCHSPSKQLANIG